MELFLRAKSKALNIGVARWVSTQRVQVGDKSWLQTDGFSSISVELPELPSWLCLVRLPWCGSQFESGIGA